VIELEIRNELLVEKIADLRTALKKLEKNIDCLEMNI
jgi:hypothetical protein